jgi:hypothetical protein
MKPCYLIMALTDQVLSWLSFSIYVLFYSLSTGDLPQHLQVMINILRFEDRIKLVRDTRTCSD